MLSNRIFLLAFCVYTTCFANLQADELSDRLTALIQQHEGTVAVYVKNLTTGATFQHQADQPLPTASLIKLPVMIETYRQAAAGQVNLDTKIVLNESDKVPGSGILTTHFSAGAELSLRDAVQLMIAFSDNTATNLVLDQIGLKSTSETMEQLGLPHTKIHAKVFRRDTSVFPERSQQFGLGSTTAAEMGDLLERLHQGRIVSSEACQTMLDHLLACDDRTKFVRFLPAGTKVAHKTGAVSNSRTDAGIIYSPAAPIVLCVLTNDNADRGWSDDNAANLLCANIAKEVFSYFNSDDTSTSTADATLAVGAMSPLVEDLQRTLNRRIEPSPGLSVDGDFGPMTEKAVKQFQSHHGLDATGVVDADTWKQLGTLITEDESVPPPAEVNAIELPRDAADSLDGPPFVTAKAWAVMDADSQKILASHQGSTPVDPASTTKIMCALVVLEAWQQDAGLGDQMVTFSDRADETPGSTSGVRTGEQLPVSELLYGLMLPSGNDASVALAEHFGELFRDADDDNEISAYELFVRQMNRLAKEIGMEHSHYHNTHGLTEDGHLLAAEDLAKLARYAMQNARFRQIVATRKHGCQLLGPGGYTRNVIWNNTNRLLGTEGYLGVKTGTTDAAGACLVSYGQRQDRNVIVVVLGSSSSDARYTDSRNLFRWAWQNLP